jgi:two-component system sensor histidine kinase NblS
LLHKARGEEPLCNSCTYHLENTCFAPEHPYARECTLYQEDEQTNPLEHHYRESLKGIAMTVQDITREVELNEAKSQFISNVSHELRTPLFNIKSFIETLHEYGEDLSEEERQEFLETANRETDRLTRLVNDVLDLSRLESCRVYHFEAVDILQPVEQTLRTYQLNAKDKNIELIQDVAPNLPPVVANYDLLLQVFANLVGNSLKFTESGGRIAIRAYSIDPEEEESKGNPQCSIVNAPSQQNSLMVRIEIGDTGIGIDTEDREAIFDRFFRVENRVHTLEGTGLGLSIVKNIIEKHHTQVHLVSEVGVGTTFWFDLAVYQSPESPEEHTESGAIAPSNGSAIANFTPAKVI